MEAAAGGHYGAVKFLVANGAAKHRKNILGSDSLHLAMQAVEEASEAVMAGKRGATRRRERATKALHLLDDRSLFACAQDGDLRRVR